MSNKQWDKCSTFRTANFCTSTPASTNIYSPSWGTDVKGVSVEMRDNLTKRRMHFLQLQHLWRLTLKATLAATSLHHLTSESKAKTKQNKKNLYPWNLREKWIKSWIWQSEVTLTQAQSSAVSRWRTKTCSESQVGRLSSKINWISGNITHTEQKGNYRGHVLLPLSSTLFTKTHTAGILLHLQLCKCLGITADLNAATLKPAEVMGSVGRTEGRAQFYPLVVTRVENNKWRHSSSVYSWQRRRFSPAQRLAVIITAANLFQGDPGEKQGSQSDRGCGGEGVWCGWGWGGGGVGGESKGSWSGWDKVRRIEEEKGAGEERWWEVVPLSGFYWWLGLALASRDKREIIIRPGEAWQPLLGTEGRQTEHYIKDWPPRRQKHLSTDLLTDRQAATAKVWLAGWDKVSSRGHCDAILEPGHFRTSQ